MIATGVGFKTTINQPRQLHSKTNSFALRRKLIVLIFAFLRCIVLNLDDCFSPSPVWDLSATGRQATFHTSHL